MPELQKIRHWIGGEYTDPASGEWLDVYEPATGKVYAQLASGNAEDVERAVQKAQEAFPGWSTMPAVERSRVLYRLSELIDERLEDLARTESIDNGKPLALARSVDIPRARDNFRFFATGLLHFASESHNAPGAYVNYTLRQPLGVVGCISPWNLPLYLFTWKIAPALAMGNCVVAKPSEVTPHTAALLGELADQAGFPPGVLNIVQGTGPGAGSAIVAHPAVKAISFTGGTATGAAIAAQAAPMFKKLSLELGGKNPNLVFADCDFDEALETSVRSSFANQGQICLCGSRIYVERSIYNRFRDAFVEKVRALKQGDPLEDGTQQGAVVSEPHYRKILAAIETAKAEGGTILCGGAPAPQEGRCTEGWFIQPTVIEGLPAECRTNQEEIFGPVVTLQPFDTEDEALGYANSVRYGLASTIWTSDLPRAHRLAERIEAGIVWINCWLLRDLRTPFGGMKDSGVGREGGWEAMRFFTEPKNICTKY